MCSKASRRILKKITRSTSVLDKARAHHWNEPGTLRMIEMNSRNLMAASSVFTGIVGIVASFLPQEILLCFNTVPTVVLELMVQVLGAAYIGFALMNWMAKAVIIGGIYARPLAMGNFAHFAIAAIALVKVAYNHSALPHLWIAASLYSINAVLFGLVLFTNPQKK